MTRCDEKEKLLYQYLFSTQYLLGTLYAFCLSLIKSCKVSEMNFYFYRYRHLSSERS